MTKSPEEAQLLEELRCHLQAMQEIVKKRKERFPTTGLAGILVRHDSLALEYQKHAAERNRLKRALFGPLCHYL